MTAKEFAVLEYFMRHPGQVLSRARFLEHVWDFSRDGDSNIVDVYVRILREKIDRPFGTRSIETVRGAGYRLRS
jgi:two-component system OmpR family response regulator